MTQTDETDETAAEPLAISFEDVRAAAARLDGVAHRTPVMRGRNFDAAAGMETAFKCEQFQRGGAFKFRGAYNRIATLDPDQRARGVIAFSSGNHAQAVALVARIFGIPAVICMPTDAPAVKVAGTRGYGAEIVIYDRLTEDREALARRLAEERGLTLMPPYNDPAIIAGQGTAALELLEDTPELDVIAAPVGGGGLICWHERGGVRPAAGPPRRRRRDRSGQPRLPLETPGRARAHRAARHHRRRHPHAAAWHAHLAGRARGSRRRGAGERG